MKEGVNDAVTSETRMEKENELRKPNVYGKRGWKNCFCDFYGSNLCFYECRLD